LIAFSTNAKRLWKISGRRRNGGRVCKLGSFWAEGIAFEKGIDFKF